MMVKAMSGKLDQQTQSRTEILFNTAFYVASKGLAFKTFQDCYTCRDRMVWTLVYNIILTKSTKSLFHNAGSYVCLLMVPMIRVPLIKGQYMYYTQDQMAGLLQYTVC